MTGQSKEAFGTIARLLARQNGAGRRGLRVVLYLPSEKGGVSQYTHHLAEHLSILGNNVTVVTGEKYELKHLPRSFKLRFLFKRSWMKALLFPGRVSGSGGSNVVVEDKSSSVQVGKTDSLHGFLKNIRRRLVDLQTVIWLLWSEVDVVHFQWLVEREADYRFIRLLQRLHFKVVYTAHNVLPHDDQSVTTKLFFHKLYRTVDRIIVHAEHLKHEMLEKFALDPEKIKVVPHGAYDLFKGRSGVSRAASRRRIGIGEDKKVLLFFGHLRRNKGLDILLDAFDDLSSRMEDTVLLVAGGGRGSGPAEYYDKLFGRLRENPQIKFVQQYIPNDEIELYFAAADVVVLPYREASQSGVLLAAYGFGRAVVATDTGGLAEVVEHGRSGFIVPPENPAALADVLQTVLRDRERLETMAQHAKLLGETKYSWKAAAVGTIDIYRSLDGTAK